MNKFAFWQCYLMWFKEILLITFQFCRLGECNWNDKVEERLHDFHAVVRTVFPGFWSKQLCFVWGKLLPTSVTSPWSEGRSLKQGSVFPPKGWGVRRPPWLHPPRWPWGGTFPTWQRAALSLEKRSVTPQERQSIGCPSPASHWRKWLGWGRWVPQQRVGTLEAVVVEGSSCSYPALAADVGRVVPRTCSKCVHSLQGSRACSREF